MIMALAGVAALGLGSAAFAVECALDAVPASTLLFPYVAYDFDQGRIDDSGQTTLFAITNVSNEAVIVHITVWTDYSIAILDFNLTLTGYDVQTINIRDIFRDGILPSDDTRANEWDTTNAGDSPLDDGPYSTFNELWGGALDTYFNTSGLPDPEDTGTYLDCDPDVWDSSPVNYRAPDGNIPLGTLNIFEGYLRASETVTTGYADCGFTGDVTSLFPLGTWFTRQDPRATAMYVTADVVNSCNKDLPDGAPGTYFADPLAPPTSGVRIANQLMGDQIWVDAGNNYSEADNAVHLEAYETLDTTDIGLKQSTFYHNLHAGLVGAQDYREPLPTAWGFRYLHVDGSDITSWVRAWRGSMYNPVVPDLALTSTGGTIGGPSPSALWSESCIPYTYYAWDEDENVNSVREVPPWSGSTDEPVPVPNLFPLETQEVPIDEFFIVEDSENPGAFFGWMMVIWSRSVWDGINPTSMDAYQSWMGVKYAAFGQYTAGLSGAVLANYNCDATQVLPVLAYTPATPRPPVATP
jgi:hypothetical protein